MLRETGSDAGAGGSAGLHESGHPLTGPPPTESMLTGDPIDMGGVEGRVWINNPSAYIQQQAPKLFGRMPETTFAQLSLQPPLFECRMVASEERRVLGMGLAGSKKDAERQALLQLCRMMDELNRDEVSMMASLASRALKAMPEGAEREPWFPNPREYFTRHLSQLDPQIAVFSHGDQFIAKVTGRVLEGLGMANAKKTSMRLAFVDACIRGLSSAPRAPSAATSAESSSSSSASLSLLPTIPDSPKPQAFSSVILASSKTAVDADRPSPSPSPSTSASTSTCTFTSTFTSQSLLLPPPPPPPPSRPVDPEDYLSQDLAEFQSLGWYCRPKDYLHAWSVRQYRQSPKYTTDTISHNGRPAFLCKVVVPGGPNLCGLGRGCSIKEASRFAAILFLVRQLGLVPEQSKASPRQLEPRSGGDHLESRTPSNATIPVPIEAAPIDCFKSSQEPPLKAVQAAPVTPKETKSSVKASSKDVGAVVAVKGGRLKAPRDSDAAASQAPSKKIKLEPADTAAGTKTMSLKELLPTDKKRLIGLAFGWMGIPVPGIKTWQVKRGAWKATYRLNHANYNWSDTFVSKTRRDAITRVESLLFGRLIKQFPHIMQECTRGQAGKKPNKSSTGTGQAAKTNVVQPDKTKVVQPDKAKVVHSAKTNVVQPNKASSVVHSDKASGVVHSEKAPPPPPLMAETKEGPLTVGDWDAPVVELKVDPKSGESIFSWLNEDRNIGRLWQTLWEVQESLVHLVQNPESPSGNELEQVKMRGFISAHSLEARSVRLLREAIEWRESARGKAALLLRQRLPAFQCCKDVLEALAMNQVVIVTGPAGSGKSTQLPHCVLEQVIHDGYGAQCNIVVTEPRRIAAVSLAHRVAEERGESVGMRVGYQVRFDSRPPEALGGITYCTTGILLNKLRTNPHLYGYSHIFIDEAHERDLLSDFAMILLRDLLLLRPELRLVIMSASLDVHPFVRYFSQLTCAVVNIECPSTPVKTLFLEDILPSLDSRLLAAPDAATFIEDEGLRGKEASSSPSPANQLDSLLNMPYSLLEAVLGDICVRTPTDESILVFLPGWEEMSTLQRCLLEEDVLRMGYASPNKFRIYLIHSQMRAFEQRAIFEVPPRGIRKIILATNIAESSITIEDVVHVVDSAKVKVSFYESEVRLRDLSCHWISRANSIQRRGRAGRTRGGGSYYCLMSRERYARLEPAQMPEIMRADLQEVCLLIKSLGVPGSVEDVLNKAMDAPEAINVRKAVQHLQEISALTKEEALTPLGQLLIKLPLSPSASKMVIYGMLLRCLDPILVIAASMTTGAPFCSTKGPDGSVVHATAADYRVIFGPRAGESDQLAVVAAFDDWMQHRTKVANPNDEMKFATENGLSLSTLACISQLKQQLMTVLEESGLLRGYQRVFEPLLDSCCSSSSSSSSLVPQREGGLIARLNENSHSPDVIKAALLVGLLPQLALCSPKSHRRLQTKHREAIMIHPSSVNYVKGNLSARSKELTSMVVAFQEKLKTRAVHSHALSTVHCQPLSLFLLASSIEGGPKSSSSRLHGTARSELAQVIQRELGLPKTLDWISYLPNCSVEGMKMFKVAVDLAFDYLIGKLCLATSSPRSSSSPTVSRVQRDSTPERLRPVLTNRVIDLTTPRPSSREFSADEILSFADKVVRTAATLIDTQ